MLSLKSCQYKLINSSHEKKFQATASMQHSDMIDFNCYKIWKYILLTKIYNIMYMYCISIY